MDSRYEREKPKTAPRRGRVLLRRTTRAGILIAAAFILSYIEAILPFHVGLPGVKLGLAHIITVFALYRLSAFEALSITLIRVLLSSLLFGNLFSGIYSFVGAFVSIGVMLLLRRIPALSPMGVSMVGGVTHNLGQLTCAVLLTGTAELGWYLPVLLVAGTVSGCVVGVVGAIAIKRIKGI